MRHADRIDNGSELAETERDAIVARRRRERDARPVNTTGRCRDCGDPINPQRLAVDPCAARCMSCQQDQDQRDKHRRHV